MARLKQDATEGNVQAAKELREWLRILEEAVSGEDIDTATTYEQLTKQQRDILRARLLREAMEVEGMATP